MGVLPDWMIERDVKIEPFSPQQKREGVISYGVTSYGYDVRCGYIFKVFSPIHAREIDPKNFDPKMLVEVDLTPTAGKHSVKTKPSGTDYCTRCSLTDEDYHWPLGCTADQPNNYILIPPHSFALAESLETFRIPRDVLCVVVGKSTYARCGLIVNVTPGEPEWEGRWTIELSNTTPLPIRVYAGEGIMQCIFIRSDGDTANVRYILRAFSERIKNRDTAAASHDMLKMLNTVEKPDDKNGTCETSYADKKGKYQNQAGLTLPTVDGRTGAEQIGPICSAPVRPARNSQSFYRPTKALVMKMRQQAGGAGCCERYANMQACDCLERAADFCSVCNDPLCDNAGGKH